MTKIILIIKNNSYHYLNLNRNLPMHLRYLLPALAIAGAHAEKATDLATAEAYHMQYNFGPPPVITPQTDINTPLENQFDYARPWLDPNVANDVAGSTTRPLQLGAQIGSHGDSERALLRLRGSNGYLIGNAYRQHLGDYKDGSGARVNAGYTRDGEALVAGIVPNGVQEYRLGVVRDSINNDKQPGDQMDALRTRRVVVNGMARFGAQDQSNTLNLSARNIHLDRRADNYSLRRAGPQRVNMKVDRNLYDLSADYRLQYGDQRSHIGLKYSHDNHNAERYLNTPQGLLRNAYRFPDVHSDRWHLYYDHYWDITPQHQLSGGLSYDHLTANPRAKNRGASIGGQTIPAPNQLWQRYYGQGLNRKAKTDGVGAVLAYEFRPNEQHTYRFAVDSLIRQPDNTERFHALPGQNGMGWIGNPHLKPERHNRISLAATWQGTGWREYGKVANGDLGGAWQIEAKADYDKVSNFITLDRARGQKGIRQDDGSVISRNVDATLIGAEIGAAKSLSTNLAARSKIRYQYGENDSDNRALYHVRPLTADIALDWRDYAPFGSYNLGVNLHYAHKNSRRDSNKATGLGLDYPTAGYATVNLYGSLQTRDRFAITLGVNNLFNRRYFAYNEQPHTAAINPNPVAAPERSVWLGFNYNF